MTSRAALVVLAALLCVSLGCGPEGEPVAMSFGDTEAFRAEAQPILAERCANPSCHGGDARPLELYATLRHRLDPASIFVDEPISDEELTLNQQRAACFINDLDHGSSLARKPLPVEEGGVQHAGGIIFLRGDDPAYLPLKAWVDATAAGSANVQGVAP